MDCNDDLELDEIPLSVEKPPNPYNYQTSSSFNDTTEERSYNVQVGPQTVEQFDTEETARAAPQPVPYPLRLSSDGPQILDPKGDNIKKGQVAFNVIRHKPEQNTNTGGDEERGHGSNYGNPERAKSLMKAGHQRRQDTKDITKGVDANSTLLKPTINSAARIQKQLTKLQALTFEEDPEAQQEVQRRVKQETTKVNKSMNYDPQDRRFTNLVPIEANKPAPVTRKVPKQVSAQYLKARELKPDIMSLYLLWCKYYSKGFARKPLVLTLTYKIYDYDKFQPEFVTTKSVYVPPSTTPQPVDPRFSSFLARQLNYFDNGLEPEDMKQEEWE